MTQGIEKLSSSLEDMKTRMKQIEAYQDPVEAKAMMIDLLVAVVILEGFIAGLRQELEKALKDY